MPWPQPMTHDEIRAFRDHPLHGDRTVEICNRAIAAEERVKVLEAAEILGREVLLPMTREQAHRLTQVAEAAGYERGVRDAAKACDWGDIYGDAAVKTILALLEQTDEANAMRKK